MEVCIYIVVCVLGIMTAQEIAAPLPSVNPETYKNFQLALDAVLGIGIRLQAVLDDEKENFLVSPISATIIIGQLLLGAEGEFRKQLVNLLSLPNGHLYENDRVSSYGVKNTTYSLPYSTLHLQLSNLLKALEGPAGIRKHFILKEKSGLFIDNRILLKPEFKDNLKTFYSPRLRSLNFALNPVDAQKKINNWARQATNGLINTIMPEPPPSDTSAIFANAIYFLAEWENPFSDVLNKVDVFNVNPSKQVVVTYMAGFIEQIMYAESTSYHMIALPYKNEELGMYIIQPKPDNPYKYSIKDFAQNLKSNEMWETFSRAKRHDVLVKIPKMTISNSFSIMDQLKKYSVFNKQQGNVKISMKSAVDTLEKRVRDFTRFTSNIRNEIYLTNATLNAPLRIDDIAQHVIITVNEKGTEAAAVSVGTMDYMGGSKNFIVDRPFVFFIRHEATSATLFWGTISNPAS